MSKALAADPIVVALAEHREQPLGDLLRDGWDALVALYGDPNAPDVHPVDLLSFEFTIGLGDAVRFHHWIKQNPTII